MKRLLLFVSITLFLLISFQRALAQTDQTVAAGASTNAANFPSGGCVYSWVNSNPSIGLAASGLGNIASFSAVNNGNVPVTAVITATPAASAFAYIANTSSNTISVINTATNMVVNTITVGLNPLGVSASKDGSRVYVTNSGSNTVSVINTASGMVIANITVGSVPYEISVSPDGKLAYVANSSSDNVSVISTATNTVLATIPTGFRPFGVLVSPDGSRVYVTSQSMVSVINTSTNVIIQDIPVGSIAAGLSLSPDGSRLYVANTNSHFVSVINTITNTVIASVNIPNANPLDVSVSPDGSRIYVTNNPFINSAVYVISAVTNTVIATIPIGTSLEGLLVSPDGGSVYVDDFASNAIVVINTATNSIIARIPVGLGPDAHGNFITSGPGCSGTPLKFTITVNPASTTPPVITASAVTGTISACTGTPSASPNIQQFTITGNNLTSDIAVTAPPGFEVSLSAPGNYGSALTISRSGNTTNQALYVRSASSALIGNISGNVVVSETGVASQNVAVTGVVNALPTVDAVANQVVQSGAATTAVKFTGTGNTFNWVNDTPGIGLPSSGTGDIASFKAVNTGATPVVATITATPVQSKGYAYIANWGSASVSVISSSTYQVVATIPVGDHPLGVAASLDGSKVYIANADGTISVIGTATNTVIYTILNNNINFNVAISPDGQWLYDTDGTLGEVSKINTTTYQQVSSVLIGSSNLPSAITLSPEGDRIYVTNPVSNNVSVINSLNNNIIATISTGQMPVGLVVSPDNKFIYVSNEGSNSISVISTSTNSVVANIPVDEPLGICISPDGSRVYVAAVGDNGVSVISTATNAVIATIDGDLYPWGISISADGRLLYVVNNFSQSVSVINTATNTLIATPNVGSDPRSTGAFVSQSVGCLGTPTKFTITVNPTAVPIINGDASTLSALTTTYGTPSASTSFKVSGTKLTAGILVTPPPGFELSTDNNSFSGAVTVGVAGTVIPTTVFIRLTGTVSAGNYSDNIVLSSPGAANVNLLMPVGTVTPAPLIVKSAGFEKQYGTLLTGGTGYIYFSTSGLQNSDLIVSVTVAYGPGAEANAAAGIYTGSVIISAATGADFNPSDYAITYVAGDLIVTQPPVDAIIATGTLRGLTTIYSIPSASTSFTLSGTNVTSGIIITPPPGFEVSIDNTTFASTITLGVTGDEPLTIVYIRLTGTDDAGTYSGNIVLSSPGAANVNVVMPLSTVNPAPLTVTADNKSRPYGTPNPVFTVTYSGFVNNEGTGQLTYQPLITTTAIITSPPGEYPITVSGGSAANYTFTYIPGVLTVTSPVTVIVIPNTFTPNGDGINDSWNLKFIDYFPNCSVNIFNRYGKKVYSSIGYPVPWDGRYKGAVLPTGVYYYIINENNGSVLSGNVTIIR